VEVNLPEHAELIDEVFRRSKNSESNLLFQKREATLRDMSPGVRMSGIDLAAMCN